MSETCEYRGWHSFRAGWQQQIVTFCCELIEGFALGIYKATRMHICREVIACLFRFLCAPGTAQIELPLRMALKYLDQNVVSFVYEPVYPVYEKVFLFLF